MRNFLKIGQVAVGNIQQVLWRNHGYWRVKDQGRILLYDDMSKWDCTVLPLLDCTKGLMLDLMRAVGGYELVSLFFLRVEPGQTIDLSENFDPHLANYHVAVHCLPGALVVNGEEQVGMGSGDIWWFSAQNNHKVINNSAGDCVFLMASIRLWP